MKVFDLHQFDRGGYEAHEFSKETSIRHVLVCCPVGIPFSIHPFEERVVVIGRQVGSSVYDTIFPAEVTAIFEGEVGDLICGLGLGIGADVERNVEGFAERFIVGFFSAGAEVGGVDPSWVIFPTWIMLLDCAGHDGWTFVMV